MAKQATLCVGTINPDIGEFIAALLVRSGFLKSLFLGLPSISGRSRAKKMLPPFTLVPPSSTAESSATEGLVSVFALWSTFRAYFLVAGLVLACVVSFVIGWKLNGINVRKAQAALTAQQAQYQILAAQGKVDALQRIKDSLQTAQEVDRVHQAELQALKDAADARPPRIIRVRCNTPVSSTGGNQAGDPPELAGESANGFPVGQSFRDVDLAGLDRIRDEAKVISSRLRGLQALCK